jgi:hypothetical protein
MEPTRRNLDIRKHASNGKAMHPKTSRKPILHGTIVVTSVTGYEPAPSGTGETISNPYPQHPDPAVFDTFAAGMFILISGASWSIFAAASLRTHFPISIASAISPASAPISRALPEAGFPGGLLP